MDSFKRVVTLAVVAATALTLMGCERRITRIESLTGPSTCAECHDASSLITGKQTEWANSVHATGTAYLRGTSAGCAGCHSGHAFAAMIAAGQNPSQVTAGDPDPTRQDCRACHMIHETYTMRDFALRTANPVALYADTTRAGARTYNGGTGNLCVTCHQPRSVFPVPVNGQVTGIRSSWGPHHGPQSAMMLGVGGAGVTGIASGHYMAVPNTCVHCHMGTGGNHSFSPAIATCKSCHPAATNFDINGVQTEIQEMIDELGSRLVAAGLIDVNSELGIPIVTSAPQAQARALWNWIYVTREDKSKGVHNPDYTRALLEAALDSLPAPATAQHR
jgi:hypothetical protein